MNILSYTALIGSLELGLIYAVLAIGVFLSYRTLATPDLTVDGSIVTGAAASAVVCTSGGDPIVSLAAAFFVGCLAGAVTALLNTVLKIEALLSGILVMLALYSINLRLMGDRPNLALTMTDTLYKNAKTALADTPASQYSGLIVSVVVVTVIAVLFYLFLNTRIGFALRATGDNEYMVRASGVNSNAMKLVGLSLSNGLVGLAGGLLAQYQSFVDISMGTGMVVIGLASVIVGETLFELFSKSLPLPVRIFAVIIGAVLYRTAIAVALNLGMPANDLKLVSASIVAVALSAGVISGKFRKLFRREMH